MNNVDGLGFSGLLRASLVEVERPEEVRILGCEVREEDGILVAERPNIFVNTGLNLALDRLFGIGGTAISHIAVSPDDQAVTGATTLLDPATGDTGFVSKAISPAASRTNQTVTAGATFTNADVSFAINKVGLLNTATDAGTGLVDVIGGTGNSPFTIDLTTAGTWSLVLQILVTASAT